MSLPIVDHYCGTARRIEKALALQSEMTVNGQALFDITLDCEDGAPVGAERDQAQMVAGYLQRFLPSQPRLGVRIHDATHPAFAQDIALILARRSQHRPAYVMIPKVESAAQAAQTIAAVHAACADVPIHVLLESAAAIQNASAIAALPAVESLSLGAMDFVSSFNGALPASAMSAAGQHANPVVAHAKLTVSMAAHAAGKVPSHCAVPEYQNEAAFKAAMQQAQAMGYPRAWSIHPDQIGWILQSFSPSDDALVTAYDIVSQARANDWAPISYQGVLQDRASYRYYWQVLTQAQRTQARLAHEITELLATGYAPNALH